MAPQKELTIDRKVELINRVVAEETKGVKGARQRIADEFKVHLYTVSRVMKNKERIMDTFTRGFKSKNQRIRDPKFSAIESDLIKWIAEMNSKGVIVNSVAIKEKAKKIADMKNFSEFKASNGWLQKFNKRNGCGSIRVHGEEKTVCEKTVQEWKEKLKSICQQYPPENIFNADELGLFYRLLPNQTYRVKGKKLKSGKLSKVRLSILLGANQTGTEKLPVLVIGRSQKPRCFKSTKVPLMYRANKKSWMTSELFKEYLDKLNEKMVLGNRKILLFVDNCPAHPRLKYTNIELVFFPPNTTSVLQPCDQGIIRSFKSKYRSFLINHFINSVEGTNLGVESVKVAIIDALQWIKSAFNEVTQETIQKCFKKCGFGDLTTDDLVKEIESSTEPQINLGINNLFGDEDLDIGSFINCDDELATASEEMASEINNEESDTELEAIELSDAEEASPNVTICQFNQALTLLRLAMDQGLIGNDCSSPIEKLQFSFDSNLSNRRKQAKITDFFNKL